MYRYVTSDHDNIGKNSNKNGVTKVRGMAKIRDQVPHLTQESIQSSTTPDLNLNLFVLSERIYSSIFQ